MNREYHKWWSDRLKRDMELLVFGHAGAKVLIFPSRFGRFYEYEKLGLVNSIKDKVQQGYLQLYCIDGIDAESLYNKTVHPKDRISRHIDYENYILEEVVPFMHKNNSHDCMISHGVSLGAFQAANIAFRNPHLFKKLVAFSGRYDLTLSIEYFSDLFDGYYDEDIYFHTPSHFLPNLECSWRLSCLREMDIILVIGKEDPFLENNQQFSTILNSKNINHQLLVWDDRAHSGYYWRRMAGIYI